MCPITIAITRAEDDRDRIQALQVGPTVIDHQHRRHHDRPIHGPVDHSRTTRRFERNTGHKQQVLPAGFSGGQYIGSPCAQPTAAVIPWTSKPVPNTPTSQPVIRSPFAFSHRDMALTRSAVDLG